MLVDAFSDMEGSYDRSKGSMFKISEWYHGS